MTCMTPTCDRPARSRGLCGRCLATAYRLIDRGGTTWAELECRGLSAPTVRAGRKPSPSPLVAALATHRRATRSRK